MSYSVKVPGLKCEAFVLSQCTCVSRKTHNECNFIYRLQYSVKGVRATYLHRLLPRCAPRGGLGGDEGDLQERAVLVPQRLGDHLGKLHQCERRLEPPVGGDDIYHGLEKREEVSGARSKKSVG